MGYDIERFGNSAPNHLNGYPQPSWFTNAGQLDRRQQAEHSERVRQLVRDTEYAIAQRHAEYAEASQVIELWKRLNLDAKFALSTARKAGLVLDNDDMELKAKFGLLDDDLFNRIRLLDEL